jgi:hypothetical protein
MPEYLKMDHLSRTWGMTSLINRPVSSNTFLLDNLESALYANHPHTTEAMKEIQEICDKTTTDTQHAVAQVQNTEFITAEHSADHSLNISDNSPNFNTRGSPVQLPPSHLNCVGHQNMFCAKFQRHLIITLSHALHNQMLVSKMYW